MVAIFFGGLVRFMPAALARFPINDGGMFLSMAEELSSNGYRLPVETGYNGLNIPYAYPPLGLYLAAGLSDVGRLPVLDVFLWLPPFLSLLAIPAFFLLARMQLPDNLHAALATLFFALTPGSYDWHVMGGGVTRAPGMLFLLLALFFMMRLFRESEWKFLPAAILFCSLAVLSHPEVGLQTAGFSAVLWVFLGRTRRGILNAVLVVIGVLLLTSPWWATVIAQNGTAPFLSALQTGGHAAQTWLVALPGLFSTAEFIPLLPLLWLAGIIYVAKKKQWLLIVLVVFPVFVDPRSATSMAHITLSMIAAFGFMDAIPLLAKRLFPHMTGISMQREGLLAASVIAVLLLVECGLANYRLINTTLTAEERRAMTWLEGHLPSNQDFMILTGRTFSMSDPVQEWFPVFSGQHSQTTLQGLEWTLGSKFQARLLDLASLQSCSTLECLDSFEQRTGLSSSYIWLKQVDPDNSHNRNLMNLASAIRSSSNYQLVYESESILVFQKIGE